MEGLVGLLEAVRGRDWLGRHLRGLFHVAIGRRITDRDGKVVSSGVTWRELSALLKDAKIDKELVTVLGGDPDELSPRDRQRMWYSAIALARPDSAEAIAEAEALIPLLAQLGYAVGPPPTALKPPAVPPVSVTFPTPVPTPKKKDDGPPKKRK